MRPVRYRKEEMKQCTTRSDSKKLTDCGIRCCNGGKVAIEEGCGMSTPPLCINDPARYHASDYNSISNQILRP